MHIFQSHNFNQSQFIIIDLGGNRNKEDRIQFINNLSNRQQHVRINNIFSSPEIVKYGVPQGAILEPILFTSYLLNLTAHVVTILILMLLKLIQISRLKL